MSTSTNCYLMGLALADLLFLFLLASILADNQFEENSKGLYIYQVRNSVIYIGTLYKDSGMTLETQL